VFGPASSRTVLDLTKPVPDAAAGVAAYAAELVLLLAGARASGPLARWASPLLGLVLMGGAAVSVALIVIQPAVAGAWCLLCLASAATSLALAVLGRDEIRAAVDLVHGSPPNRLPATRGVASPGRG
jgi:uncharacterized membrane protein